VFAKSNKIIFFIFINFLILLRIRLLTSENLFCNNKQIVLVWDLYLINLNFTRWHKLARCAQEIFDSAHIIKTYTFIFPVVVFYLSYIKQKKKGKCSIKRKKHIRATRKKKPVGHLNYCFSLFCEYKVISLLLFWWWWWWWLQWNNYFILLRI